VDHGDVWGHDHDAVPKWMEHTNRAVNSSSAVEKSKMQVRFGRGEMKTEMTNEVEEDDTSVFIEAQKLMAEWRDIFEECDADKSGFLDSDELMQVLAMWKGEEMIIDNVWMMEVKALIAKYGAVGQGDQQGKMAKKLEFDEFLELYIDHQAAMDGPRLSQALADEVRRLNRREIKQKDLLKKAFHKTGELYSHTLKNDEEYCWVLVFPNEEHEKYNMDEFERTEVSNRRTELMKSLLLAGLALKTYSSVDNDELFVQVGSPQRYLEFVATLKQEPIARLHTERDHDENGKISTKVVKSYEPFDLLDMNKGFISAKAPWIPKGAFAFRSKARIQLVEHLIRLPWDPKSQHFGADMDLEVIRNLSLIIHVLFLTVNSPH